jgi:hypothetical protein
LNATTRSVARMDRHEQDRQYRLVRAQIDRDREAARAQDRIAEREADARVKLETAAARRAARAAARDDRAARLAGVASWVSGHVVGLLFVPVIGVPALLSWTAMAAFGMSLYGVPGATLPAFSEGAMWAFAATVTLTLRRYPGRPVWHLRAGIAAFAVFGAGLNYVHGSSMATLPGLPHGPVTGGVMAAVSVAGVIAHQLITAGPQDKRQPAEEPPAATEPAELPPVPTSAEPAAGAVAELPAPEPVTVAPVPVAEPAPVPVPTTAEHAAELAFRATHAAGNPLSGRQLEARFGLPRSAATKVRQRVLAELDDRPADEPDEPARSAEMNEVRRLVREWHEDNAVPGGGTAPAHDEPVTDAAPEPAAV